MLEPSSSLVQASRGGTRTAVTVREVARLAGVSTATVSRALDPRTQDLVSEERRLRVLQAAEELRFTPNPAARSLKTGSSRTIAIVAPELSNDFFMELSEGLERELESAGYQLVIACSGNSLEGERRRVAALADRLVDGFVVIPAGSTGDHLTALAASGIPVVLVDRDIEGTTLDRVASDNEGGAREAVLALVADGFRRIAFVGGDLSLSTARERLAGYRRALADSGIPFDPALACLGGMSLDEGYLRMDSILAMKAPPSALFAVNLYVHLGLQRRLLEEHASVSNRFTVAGFDESLYSAFFPHCSYAVAQDASLMGSEAARIILSRLSGNAAEAPSTLRLKTTLIRHSNA